MLTLKLAFSKPRYIKNKGQQAIIVMVVHIVVLVQWLVVVIFVVSVGVLAHVVEYSYDDLTPHGSTQIIS